MNSYDYLMTNLQEALKKQVPLMRARNRKGKIKELYEKYKNSTTIRNITETGLCYRPYRFSEKN